MAEVPTSTKPCTVLALRHSGTHLIMPLVKTLTGKGIYRPKGINTLTCVPNGPVVVFLRDPRNWLIASFRWKRGTLPQDHELAEFIAATKKRGLTPPLTFATKWADRWLSHPGALVLRFEDVVSPTTGLESIERLRSFLGAETSAADARAAVVGGGTYTGRHSNWRETFGPLSTAAFKRHGGYDLLKKMGYASA